MTKEQETTKRKHRSKAEIDASIATGLEKPRKPRAKKVVAEKPPTQGVGVIGINDSVFGADTSGIRWGCLIHVPKFQMFCVERFKKDVANIMDWIIPAVKSELEKDIATFFKEYTDWHDVKGYWQNENPYGELI